MTSISGPNALRQGSCFVPLFAIAFPNIDPVIIHLGPLAIRWYALAYIAGLLLGWRLARRLVRREGWLPTEEQVDDLLFYATLGVIIGGRMGFVIFYHPVYFLQNPLQILAVWQGGMSFHGGLIGVITAVFIFARQSRLPVLELLDVAAVVTPIGLFFGRIANFINGELWGRVSDVPWAMVFPTGGPEPRHPSQLYQAMLEGVVLFAVMFALSRRPRIEKERGLLSGAFLIGYAVARTIGELFRQPDAHLGFLFGFITMGQLLSIPMLLLGLFLVRRALR
ncbi:MAG: prolipoprotein diacylglyceryl transferase [Geminicoccaceae bacterium]|nr:prolipoprotein diacylglyceryl transferase [Geminicoccaceae bacterium]MCB9943843.1 prolipoprotein diacylglyceryl transferase [Geminicoccaceae bacterium]